MSDCNEISNLMSSISSVLGVLLLVSELLPYASSSKCNSIIEGISHIFCRASCLVSNKNIRFENEVLKHENEELKTTKKDLTEEMNYIKRVVLDDISQEIKSLRRSLDQQKNNSFKTNHSKEAFVENIKKHIFENNDLENNDLENNNLQNNDLENNDLENNDLENNDLENNDLENNNLQNNDLENNDLENNDLENNNLQNNDLENNDLENNDLDIENNMFVYKSFNKLKDKSVLTFRHK